MQANARQNALNKLDEQDKANPMFSDSCEKKAELFLAYNQLTLAYAEALLDMQRRRLRLSEADYIVLCASIDVLGNNARKARFWFEAHLSEHGC